MNIFFETKRSRLGTLVKILIIIMLVVVFVWLINRMLVFDLSSFNMEKYQYASDMGFNMSMTVNGITYQSYELVSSRLFGRGPFSLSSPLRRRIELDIVLVHDRSEAESFPENVIVAWPSTFIPHRYLTKSEIIVARFNLAASESSEELRNRYNRLYRSVIRLEDFGLTYPVTVSDLVCYWEEVYAFWYYLHSSEQIDILQRGWMQPLPRDKRAFASPIGFGFDFLVIVYGEARIGPNVTDSRSVEPWRAEFDEFYDSLVFVRHEDEAHDFPANVVVAWPKDDCPELQRRLNQINWEVQRDSNSIAFGGIAPFFGRRPVLGAEGLERDFGLTYPITVDDLVYNWRQVFDLIMHLELGW